MSSKLSIPSGAPAILMSKEDTGERAATMARSCSSSAIWDRMASLEGESWARRQANAPQVTPQTKSSGMPTRAGEIGLQMRAGPDGFTQRSSDPASRFGGINCKVMGGEAAIEYANGRSNV